LALRENIDNLKHNIKLFSSNCNKMHAYKQYKHKALFKFKTEFSLK